MGRPATGNRGISLRKGDYVIGAAVTPSNEARNKQRLELAAAKRPHRQGRSRHRRGHRSTAVTPLELSGDPAELSRPRPLRRGRAKLEKLDEQLGLTPCLILSVTENGYGKRTDVDHTACNPAAARASST